MYSQESTYPVKIITKLLLNKMACAEKLDIDGIWRELQARDTVYTRNQELCVQLGLKDEKARNIEDLLKNAKIEIKNRDCLIEKVLKQNENLECLLQNQRANHIEPSETINNNSENDKLKRELEHCQNIMKLLEEKCERSLDCIKDKEDHIESLKEQLQHMTKTLYEQLEPIKESKELLESQVRKDQELIRMLQHGLKFYNKNYETICKHLQEKTTELNDLKSEYENYKNNVKIIKAYVSKNTFEQDSVKSSFSKDEPRRRRSLSHLQRRDIQCRRYEQKSQRNVFYDKTLDSICSKYMQEDGVRKFEDSSQSDTINKTDPGCICRNRVTSKYLNKSKTSSAKEHIEYPATVRQRSSYRRNYRRPRPALASMCECEHRKLHCNNSTSRRTRSKSRKKCNMPAIHVNMPALMTCHAMLSPTNTYMRDISSSKLPTHTRTDHFI